MGMKTGVYDVIVAGGGPAGIAAAMASARNGARTLLVESMGSLGGTVTNGSLPAFCPYGNTDSPLIRGIGLEILEALRAQMTLPAFYTDTPEKPLYSWFPVDSEALKIILDEKVAGSGCDLLLHTHVVGCRKDGSRITQIETLTGGTRMLLQADVFIDCTGDASLAAEAGCQIRVGNECGQVQSGTLCFKVAGFDTERFIRYVREDGEDGNLRHACARAMADGAFPEGETKVAGFSLPFPGVAVFNFGHIYGIDPTDPHSMTQAEITGRKRLRELLKFLRNYVPGAEDAHLVESGPNVGIRESRRVMGEYMLTREDFFRRADFEDAIAYYCYPIDVHGFQADDRANQEWNEIYYNQRYRPGEAYAVPYRSLIPLSVENLLTAGKIISCDQAMLGSVRVVPCCFATGQAAGTAAAMAVHTGKSVRDISVPRLRETLESQGCYLRHGTKPAEDKAQPD